MDIFRFLRRWTARGEPGTIASLGALGQEIDAVAGAVGKFLLQTGLFDREEYVRTYPDVAASGLDPLPHFLLIGIHGGRRFASRGTIDRLWREVLEAAPAPPLPEAPAGAGQYRAAIYVSSLGNFFMREMADLLKAGFDDAGVAAQIVDENAEEPQATHHIVVAPHEFFILGVGRRWATEKFLRRAVMLSTEQLQSTWFARSLQFLLRAKAVAEMNEQSAMVLRKAGVRAFAVQPGYSSAFKAFAAPDDQTPAAVLDRIPLAARSLDAQTATFSARPLDLVFLGSRTPRRERLLEGYASSFASLQTVAHCPLMDRPLRAESDPMASTAVTVALLRRTKLLLNLHRDDYAYFEWWRLMQAFWLKTVVVTEPCFPHSIYKPGMHFFEAPTPEIPELVDWLARSPEGHAKAEEVRERAYDQLVARSTAKAAALALLALGA